MRKCRYGRVATRGVGGRTWWYERPGPRYLGTMFAKLEPRRPRFMKRRGALAVTCLTLVACGGPMTTGGGAGVATDAEWRALRQDRPDPLPGAPRLTVAEVAFLGSFPWPEAARPSPDIGMSELVVANLLRRRDVHFVERRRFDAAATAERRGEAAPPNRPPPGVSVGAELDLIATWVPTTPERANLEIRLTRLETGDVEGTTRVTIERGADPVSVARSIVSGTLALLDDLGRLPSGSPTPANVAGTDGVSPEALRHFLRGLAAEERWDWEGARRGYQQALAVEADFVEARSALERTARLRLGGTLAES